MARQRTTFKDAYNRTLDFIASGSSFRSEPDLGRQLGVSRTTARQVLEHLAQHGIVATDGSAPVVRRRPGPDDYFAREETEPVAAMIERAFMTKILERDARAGAQINELELAREIGVGTTSVREFLIRFSRFGLIEKRRNSHWVLKGFNRRFADELIEVREMFELRSAFVFADLPEGHPNWARLSELAAEHKSLLSAIEEQYTRFSELDERFHRFIHSASLNRFIIDFYDVIAMIFHYHYQWNKQSERSRNERAVHEHLDYIAALQSRDRARVEAACKAHLATARVTLVASMPTGDS